MIEIGYGVTGANRVVILGFIPRFAILNTSPPYTW